MPDPSADDDKNDSQEERQPRWGRRDPRFGMADASISSDADAFIHPEAASLDLKDFNAQMGFPESVGRAEARELRALEIADEMRLDFAIELALPMVGIFAIQDLGPSPTGGVIEHFCFELAKGLMAEDLNLGFYARFVNALPPFILDELMSPSFDDEPCGFSQVPNRVIRDKTLLIPYLQRTGGDYDLILLLENNDQVIDRCAQAIPDEMVELEDLRERFLDGIRMRVPGFDGSLIFTPGPEEGERILGDLRAAFNGLFRKVMALEGFDSLQDHYVIHFGFRR